MSASLLHRYLALETLLQKHAPLWRPIPFHSPVPPWATSHPELYNALLALPEDATHQLEHDAQALHAWLLTHLPELDILPALVALPRLQGTLPRPWPTGFEWDIPGRKWAQIEAFTAAVTPGSTHFVDWCAGKGHLSRSLSFQHQVTVDALEKDASLCNAAHALNRKMQTRVTPHVQDVLAPDARQHLAPHSHGVALHACGKLHVRLLDTAARIGVKALSLSPCCYHLIEAPAYIAMTQVDASVIPRRLQLARDELRLAVQETVTANGHARRLRERKSAWKLGFKRLCERSALSATAGSLSLADRYFHDTFESFCRQAALQVGVTLPADPGWESAAWEAWELEGWEAHGRLKRLELVRHGFRRALEIWLCLDRACWLEQQGYRVTVGTFCDAAVTPRNVLITAER